MFTTVKIFDISDWKAKFCIDAKPCSMHETIVINSDDGSVPDFTTGSPIGILIRIKDVDEMNRFTVIFPSEHRPVHDHIRSPFQEILDDRCEVTVYGSGMIYIAYPQWFVNYCKLTQWPDNTKMAYMHIECDSLAIDKKTLKLDVQWTYIMDDKLDITDPGWINFVLSSKRCYLDLEDTIYMLNGYMEPETDSDTQWDSISSPDLSDINEDFTDTSSPLYQADTE